MELLKDLLRDLIGIIFPGGLLVFFSIIGFFGVGILIVPPGDILGIFKNVNSSTFNILFVIFSFIAGQNIRIRRLVEVEKKATESYRKKQASKWKKSVAVLTSEFETYRKAIHDLISAYYKGEKTDTDLAAYRENIRKLYEKQKDVYELWERFPYPLQTKVCLFLEQPKDMIDFYGAYIENQNIIDKEDEKGFFNYCKVCILCSNSALKDEVLREEALIRLMAGLIFVIRTGVFWIAIVLFSHLLFWATRYLDIHDWFFQADYAMISVYSKMFFIGSIVTLSILLILRREILTKNGLRIMRHKEVNVVFESYFLVKTKK